MNNFFDEQRIFPFLWINDETNSERVKAEIDEIKNCGLDAFCVESRIHSGFCKEEWFELMREILEYAKEKQMKVWLLDAKAYPTGCVDAENRSLFGAPLRIAAKRVDTVGKIDNARVLINTLQSNDEVAGVYLLPFENGEPSPEKADEADYSFDGNFVKLNIPDGKYAIVTLVLTRKGFELPDYFDSLDGKSVDKLIETVYEPHYERFKEYFGNTFVGFFSDEPRFGNGYYEKYEPFNVYGYDTGASGMSYPWNDEVQSEFFKKHTLFDVLYMWYGKGEKKSETRISMTDITTALYSRNFTKKISAWCEERGVIYTGHVIEDMGNHVKTGSGTGHYFRSMKGERASAVDVVLHQLKPCFLSERFRSAIEGGYSDAKFFCDVLPVLAASSAAMDDEKNGNALCEIFGAFGWNESVKDMLWYANIMMVNGVNAFLPHAFSAKYPNADCPPHFGMEGKYPAKSGFKELIRYMKRVCETFSFGKRYASVAVLYNAEADWSGERYYPTEEIANELASNQIPFDFLPYDNLKIAKSKNGKIVFGERTYLALLIPKCEGYTSEMRKTFAKFADSVVYVGERGLFENEESQKKYAISYPKKPCSHLRILTYEKTGKLSFMLFNAGNEDISGEFVLPNGNFVISDYLGRTARKFTGEEVFLALKKGETLFIEEIDKSEIGDLPEPDNDAFIAENRKIETVKASDISGKEYLIEGLTDDVNSQNGSEDFCGKISTTISCENVYGIRADYCGEYLKVKTPTREIVTIKSPAELFFGEPFTGEIEIETSNTPANREKDYFSAFAVTPPAGFKKIETLKKADRND